MMRAGGWIAGGLLVTGCFFQPQLDGGTGGESSEDGTGTGSATRSTEVPTGGGATETGETASGAQCGDFKVDEGEKCDNGESNNGGGSACKGDCTLNVCGDGYLATFEGCDDGNTVEGDGCDAMCKSEGCGDGVTNGAEQCDDGNPVDDDQCSNLCRLPVCGDGVVNGDDECDQPEGNSDMGACLSTCQDAECGDGFVWDGVEACDDGNSVDVDGCSNACVVVQCGDGVVSGAEECDDGNDIDTDFCRNTCVLAKCGDGVVQVSDEECDPPGPTCSGLCERTGFWVFLSSEAMTGDEVEGTSAADMRCTTLAAGTMVAGSYKAWLSSNTMNSAENRLYHSTLPYVRPDGVKVADHWPGFTSGVHLVPINVTEEGQVLAANPPGCNDGKSAAVWTGSEPDGKAGETCFSWVSGQGSVNGQGGLFNRADAAWSNCSFPCDAAARLYCVEQP